MKHKSHPFKEWIIAVRPWSFPASAMPVIVTMGYLLWKSGDPHVRIDLNLWYGLWALINIVVFHAAGNTWSDYFDFRKSVDRKDTFGVKTLTSGMFAPEEIRRLSLCLLAAAMAGGIGLLALTGLPLLWIGLGGIACTLLYPALKYRALGDLVIFIAYAVLPVMGTSYAVTGTILADALWLSVPVGLITVAILHANNTRDTETDRRAHIRTLAMDIGQKASRAVYYAEILVPFIWTAACTAVGIFPVWCLLVLPAAVPAALNLKAMKGSRTEGPGAIGSLDEMTAKLQMTFSLLFTISFVLAYFL